MDCNQARAQMSAAVDDVLADAECQELDTHVARCAACQEYRQSLTHVAALFSAAGSAAPPLDFTARVMSRLHAEHRYLPALAPARGQRPALAWACAALAIALAWAGLFNVGLRVATGGARSGSVVSMSMTVSSAAIQLGSLVDGMLAVPARLLGAVPAPAIVLLALWLIVGTLVLGLIVGGMVAAYRLDGAHSRDSGGEA